MISHLCQLNQLVKSLKTPLMNSKKPLETLQNLFSRIFFFGLFESQNPPFSTPPFRISSPNLATPSRFCSAAQLRIMVMCFATSDLRRRGRHMGCFWRRFFTVIQRWFNGHLTSFNGDFFMVIQWWLNGDYMDPMVIFHGDFPWLLYGDYMVILWWFIMGWRSGLQN